MYEDTLFNSRCKLCLLFFEAFLPSTFAMYMVLLSYGGWFAGNYAVSSFFFFHQSVLVSWCLCATVAESHELSQYYWLAVTLYL